MSSFFIYAKIILFIYFLDFNHALESNQTDNNCNLNLDLLKPPNVTKLQFKSCIKAYNSTINNINYLIPLKDGKIVTVNDKINLRVFDSNKNFSIVKDFYSIFDSVILLKDGRIALSNAKNNSININILDSENFDIVESYSTPVEPGQNVSMVNFMAQLANGWIVTISNDDGLRLWDNTNKMKLLYTRIEDDTKDISSVVAVSNGDFLTHSIVKNHMYLWETSNLFKKPINIAQSREEYAYTNLNEIKGYIAGASLNEGLVLLDTSKPTYFSERHLTNNHTGDVLGTTIELPTGILINGLTFSLSNNSLVLWDSNKDFEGAGYVQGLGRVSKIAKSSNGDLFIATGKGEIIIWEYKSGFGTALFWIITVFALTLFISLVIGIFISRVKKMKTSREASLLKSTDV
jgi:WD40 repeat protein